MSIKATLFLLFIIAPIMTSTAQDTEHVGKEHNLLVTAKISQLYGELGIGAPVSRKHSDTDIVYVAFGYGYPTRKNAWRKFIPQNIVLEEWPKELKDKVSQRGMDGIHAGKVGIGWYHWVSRRVGFYLQTGWGFVADLAEEEELTEDEIALLEMAGEKKTFLYHTLPVEAGIAISMWKSFHVQAGLTYMWKEIPLLTLGVGCSF